MLKIHHPRFAGPVAIFSMLAVLAVLAGCAAKPARAPDTHYDLAVAMPAVAFGTTSEIALRRVDIRGVQSGRSLVVVTGENPRQFQEQRGHFWHVAAPTLIERAFIDAMNRASSDARFGTMDTIETPDYRVVLDVTEFAYNPQGEAMIRFTATVASRDGGIVLSERYWASAALAGRSPADGVMALSDATSKAFALFASELAKAL